MQVNKSWQLAQREGRVLAIGELIALAWLVGLGILVLLGTLVLGHPSWAALTPQSLLGDLCFVTGAGAMIYGLVAPYGLFKRAIQNGIPRPASWLAKEMTLVGALVVAGILMALNGVVTADRWSTVGMSWGALAVGTVTLATIGAGFALLTRRWKVIVGIGLPILALILVTRIMTWLVTHWNPSVTTLQTLERIFTNPVTGWVVLVTYLILMVGIDYGFFMRLQLRRD